MQHFFRRGTAVPAHFVQGARHKRNVLYRGVQQAFGPHVDAELRGATRFFDHVEARWAGAQKLPVFLRFGVGNRWHRQYGGGLRELAERRTFIALRMRDD